QKVGCPLPGVCAIPIYEGSRDSFDGGGVQRCTNLVAEYCQGACRYARISYPQHAASDEIRHSVLMYAQHLPQPPQRPPVGNLGTDPEYSKPTANGAFGTAKAPSNLLRWFVPNQRQQL